MNASEARAIMNYPHTSQQRIDEAKGYLAGRQDAIQECLNHVQEFIDHPYTSDTQTEMENLKAVLLTLKEK